MSDLTIFVPMFQHHSYHDLPSETRGLYAGLAYDYWLTKEALGQTYARTISQTWRERIGIIRVIADHSYVHPLEFCTHKLVGTLMEFTYCVEDNVQTMIHHFTVPTTSGSDLARLLVYLAIAESLGRISLLQPLLDSIEADPNHIHNTITSPICSALHYFLRVYHKEQI